MISDRIGQLILIDDNAIEQRLYRLMIERSGRVDDVVSFCLATDALAYLCAEDTPEPDLILLDVNMPIMDGFEFLEALKARFGERVFSIVVMLTTSLDEVDAERAARSSAIKDYVNKPLTADRLDDLITRACKTVQHPVWHGPIAKIAPETFAGQVG